MLPSFLSSYGNSLPSSVRDMSDFCWGLVLFWSKSGMHERLISCNWFTCWSRHLHHICVWNERPIVLVPCHISVVALRFARVVRFAIIFLSTVEI